MSDLARGLADVDGRDVPGAVREGRGRPCRVRERVQERQVCA
ncbi:hypothetical protein [Halorubellus salinus]|nr:hypothetical protein [Halorubellus salinus]